MPFVNSLRVGSFLAVRYLRRASIWTTALIVFVMALTFLNLVVVTGILVGLIEGAEQAFNENYAGDILISTLPGKNYIEHSPAVLGVLSGLDSIRSYAPRYLAAGTVEANYQRNLGQANVAPDTVGAEIAGIDLLQESLVTNLSDFIVEGSFLVPGEEDRVVLGGNLLSRYLPGEFGLETLDEVYVGDKVLITIEDVRKEFVVKGIIDSKADSPDLRVYMSDTQLRNLLNRYDYSVNEVAVRLAPGATPEAVRATLQNTEVGRNALVRTADEAIGSFIEDIKTTFSILGNVIGSIGLAVASITIFIVIFITAITRQKSIGILKGIGVTDIAIETSYVILSIFYALIGIALGFFVLYVILVPYFDVNPIDFPFSDGILAVTTAGSIIRSVIIVITTIIAGYIPARLVVKKPALDAILGR